MLIYFLIVTFPILFIIYNKKKKFNKYLFIINYIFITFFIGLRKVGSDYTIYEMYYKKIENSEKFIFNGSSDIAFDFLLYSFSKLNVPFEIIIFISSAFFLFCIFKLCSLFKNPWVPFFISLPILIMIFGMSAIRQSIALGFLILGILSILNKNKTNFCINIFIGTLFHKSLIIFSPLFFILYKPNIRNILIITFLILAFFIFNFLEFKRLFFNYFLNDGLNLYSKGFYVRAVPHIFSLLIFYFLIFKKLKNETKYLLTCFSFYTFLFLAFGLINTTGGDRMMYYSSIFYIFIFTYFIENYSGFKKVYFCNLIIVIILMLGIFSIWMLYGSNTHQWLPYRSIFNI
jgi:hypothetical protein